MNLPTIRSYAKGWEGALIANQLLAKQTAREQKKTTAVPAKPEVKKLVIKDSPTQKKQKADAKIEQQMAAQRRCSR